jgi:hypothetical protein
MRANRKWLHLAALVGCLGVMRNVHNASTQQRTPVTLTRIYTGSDGQTHGWKPAFFRGVGPF